MKIKKDSKSLFIRLVDYKRNDFAEEHYKTFLEHKKVWILKMGRRLNEEFIKDVIKDDGCLIIKSTARNGNQFYICKLNELNQDEEYIYPEYYNELFEENSYELSGIKRLGTWLKIVDMKKIDRNTVEKFETISTKRSLYECGTKFNQVSQIYVTSKENIEL